MTQPSRMPRYDVRNDGSARMLCSTANRATVSIVSTPDMASTVAKDVGRQTMGGLLRNIPLVGGAVANRVESEDPRYIYSLTPQQLEEAWQQVSNRFRECPTCARVVCLSDFDEQAGYCTEDSPRRDDIAQAQAEQARCGS